MSRYYVNFLLTMQTNRTDEPILFIGQPSKQSITVIWIITRSTCVNKVVNKNVIVLDLVCVQVQVFSLITWRESRHR